MNYFLAANNKPTDIVITFSSKQKCKAQTIIHCLDTNVIYSMRQDIVANSKSVVLKIPNCPKNLIINIETDIPDNLRANIASYPIRKYNIQLGAKQKEFISFIEQFCDAFNHSKLKPSDNIIKSNSGDFKIVLLPAIRTYEGQIVGTPCQIGSKSGIIEVDANLFGQHTQSGQIALLCHEYAHFYENPRYGLPKKSEEGADQYGLLMYLGAGYAETEYVNAFKRIFKRVDTTQNRQRIEKIFDLASKINSGKIFGKPY
jgi:hypothetical protein